MTRGLAWGQREMAKKVDGEEQVASIISTEFVEY
jgi:hypothetical protein